MPYDPESMTQQQAPLKEGFEDEGVDDELNFVDRESFRRANTRRSYNRMCIVAIPVLMGALVATFLFLANGRDKSSGGGAGGAMSSFTLPPPPADLEARCSDIANNKLDCQEACEVAECCGFPANLPLSCLESNHDTCLAYHSYCHVLTETPREAAPSSVPPAPANLAETCAQRNLLTVEGFQECHEACAHAECCYETSVETCSFNECHGYAPCLTLAATDNVHPAIEAHVDAVCRGDNLMTFEGRTECRQACLHALCCFADDPSQACPHHDNSFCDQYTACDTIERDVNTRATGQEIAETCASGHKRLCERQCERGACCFTKEGCAKLYPDNVCSNYDPCKQLYKETEEPEIGDETTEGSGEESTEGGDDTSPPLAAPIATVDEACNESFSDFPAKCEELCKDAKCCFEAYDCFEEVSEGYDCTKHSACSAVWPGEENPLEHGDGSELHTISKDTVDNACLDTMEENKPPGQQSLCEKLCMDAKCCFARWDCAKEVPDDLDCVAHESCAKIWDHEAQNGGAGGSGSSEGTTEEGTSSGNAGAGDETLDRVSKETVDNACYNTVEENKPPGQESLCEKLCMDAKCCFDNFDCRADVPGAINCDDHIACGKIWDPENFTDEQASAGGEGSTSGGGGTGGDETLDTVSKETVDNACNNSMEENKPPGQESLCEKLCKDAKCCFDHWNCPDDVPEALKCEDHLSCAKLWDLEESPSSGGSGGGEESSGAETSTGGETAAVSVEEACADDFDGDAGLCAALCEPAKCCFEINDCFLDAEESGINCQANTICEKVWPATGSGSAESTGESTGEESKSSEQIAVEGACDPNFDETTSPGESTTCELLCEKAKCCFGGQDCVDQVPADVICADYEACELVYESIEVIDPDPEATGEETGEQVDPPPNGEEAGLAPEKGGESLAVTVGRACDPLFQESPPSGQREKCEAVCSGSKCCFTDCTEGTPENFDCGVHLPCGVLYQPESRKLEEHTSRRRLGGDHVTKKDILTKLCLEPTNGNLDNCKTVCSQGSCCFSEAGCTDDSTAICDDYVPCHVLYDGDNTAADKALDTELEQEEEEDEEEEEALIEKEGRGESIEITKEKIEAACDTNALKSVLGTVGHNACGHYCISGACCFSDTQECDETVDCEIYIACAGVVPGFASFQGSLGGKAESITESTSKQDEGKSTTITYKAPSDSKGNNSTDRSNNLAHHKTKGPDASAPRDVVEMMKASGDASTMTIDRSKLKKIKIDEACDGNDTSHCVRQCAEAACCYALEDAEKCAAANPEINCEVYEACDSVFGHGQTGDEDKNGRQ